MRRITLVTMALLLALAGLAGCATTDSSASGKPMLPDRTERMGGGY